MSQCRLRFPPSQKTIKAVRLDYDRRNLESAREVLSATEKYGGEEAGLVQWAKAVIERLEGNNGR